ncbi:MAG: SMC family ATPase, partial [Campylobacteraceae bacterium]|nr:SMC family ATPase [Campylobacteraceae bacterium]
YKSLYEKIKVHIINKEQIIKKEALEKEQLSLREQYLKAKNDISILEKECCEYDNLIIKDKNLSLDLKELKSILKEEKEKEKEIQILIASEKNIISQTNEKMLRIQELGKTSSCPICTRPLLDEYDNVLTSLNATINEIQKNKIDSELLKLEILSSNIKDSELKYETFNSEYIHLSQRINLIESKKKDLLFSREHFEKVKTHGLKNKEELELLKDYTYNEDEHKSDANHYNELKEKYEYVLELETLIKRVDILKEEESKTRKELKDLNELKLSQDKLFEDIIYIKDDHTKEEVLYSQVENIVKEINTIINNLKVEIANIQGEIKVNLSILENNSKHKNKVKDKQNDLLEYDLIKSSLIEFKRKLNAKIAPRISDISSKMFASITKGKYEHIEVNNDFDFFIYDNGKKYPIERFSGGEIDLANLVLRIAISKTLSELNSSSSIEFLAFDEVFGSQDESRRMEILEAFHTIKEQYRQIFLISHEIDIKEMFETVIEV